VVEIHVFSCQAQNEHYPTKVADANHEVKKHVCPREGLGARIGVVKSDNESTFTHIGSNTQDHKYPPKSLVTFGKASVGRHDKADEKKDRIVEKIGPGMRSMKEASQTDPHEDQWNQEQEYATPTVAPIRHS
jgi:hypothetical protein